MTFFAGDTVQIYRNTGVAATFVTDVMAIERFGSIAVQAVVANASGDINFVAQPEVSLDQVNWDAWSQPDTISPANLNSSFNLNGCAFSYLRVKYTRVAGNGDFVILARGKQN